MKKIFLLIGILIVVILSGCEILANKPYILDIGASQEHVLPNDQFKVFLTIKNPTQIEFKPVILLNFDKKTFSYQNYYVEKQRISLEPVPSGQQKSYLLQFTVDRDAKSGLVPIGIYLLGEEGATQSLDYKEKSIDILSNVQR